jgi:hypothetical protein
MDSKTPQTSLFIAQPTISAALSASVQYPLGNFYRYEISFLQRFFTLPLYPDRTNVGLENTRAQVRYRLLPMVETLGFGLATKQEQHSWISTQEKHPPGSTHQQRRPTATTRPVIETLVLAIKRHLKFELPGTRTPNCPIKSRELYH